MEGQEPLAIDPAAPAVGIAALDMFVELLGARGGRPVLRCLLQPAVRGDLPPDLDGARGDLPLRRGAPARARGRRLRHPAGAVRRGARDRGVRPRRAPGARGGPRDRGRPRRLGGVPGGVPRARRRDEPRVHADGRRGALVRRHPLRPQRQRPAVRRGALPAVDARQDRGAGQRRPRRRRPGHAGAPAAGAHRPRARRARERDPAAVRRPARVLQLRRAAARGARADRRRAAGRAGRPAAGAATPARAPLARDADDAAGGDHAPAPREPRPAPRSSPAGPSA